MTDPKPKMEKQSIGHLARKNKKSPAKSYLYL
jgi:hypothetical protein